MQKTHKTQKQLTQQEIQQIIDLHKNGGKRPNELALMFGSKRWIIKDILKNAGANQPKKKASPTNQDKEQIIRLYQDKKLSSEKIADMLEWDAGVIRRVLKEKEVSLNPSELKIDLNAEYFVDLQTAEQAFYLGAFVAIGEILPENALSGVKFHASLEQKKLILNLSKVIFKDQDYSYSIYPDQISLAIYSKKIQKSLVEMDEKWLEVEKHQLFFHFLRGYWEADPTLIKFQGANLIFTIENEQIAAKLLEALKTRYNSIVEQEKGIFELSAISQITELMEQMFGSPELQEKQLYRDYLKIKTVDPVLFEMTNKQSIKYVEQLSEEQKKILVNQLTEYHFNHGFPFIRLNQDGLMNDFYKLQQIDENKICQDNILSINNFAGNNSVRHFSPHFYEVKSGARGNRKSMLETFSNKEMLHAIIGQKLENGIMDRNQLRNHIAKSKFAYQASVFNTVLAKYVWNRYAQDGDIVYDYCMGFGNRLLGALSLEKKLTYVGSDPFDKMHQSNRQIFEFYRENDLKVKETKQVDFFLGGAEEIEAEKYRNQISVAFSSPPYYNLEIYENHPKQAYCKNTCTTFVNVWWDQVVKNIDIMLKSDGVFILNICDFVDNFPIGCNMLKVCQMRGFEVFETLKMKLNEEKNSENEVVKAKYEPIYVMRRKNQNNVCIT